MNSGSGGGHLVPGRRRPGGFGPAWMLVVVDQNKCPEEGSPVRYEVGPILKGLAPEA